MAAPRRQQACPCLPLDFKRGWKKEEDSAKRAEGARHQQGEKARSEPSRGEALTNAFIIGEAKMLRILLYPCMYRGEG